MSAPAISAGSPLLDRLAGMAGLDGAEVRRNALARRCSCVDGTHPRARRFAAWEYQNPPEWTHDLDVEVLTVTVITSLAPDEPSPVDRLTPARADAMAALVNWRYAERHGAGVDSPTCLVALMQLRVVADRYMGVIS